MLRNAVGCEGVRFPEIKHYTDVRFYIIIILANDGVGGSQISKKG